MIYLKVIFIKFCKELVIFIKFKDKLKFFIQ